MVVFGDRNIVILKELSRVWWYWTTYDSCKMDGVRFVVIVQR